MSFTDIMLGNYIILYFCIRLRNTVNRKRYRRIKRTIEKI